MLLTTLQPLTVLLRLILTTIYCFSNSILNIVAATMVLTIFFVGENNNNNYVLPIRIFHLQDNFEVYLHGKLHSYSSRTFQTKQYQQKNDNKENIIEHYW